MLSDEQKTELLEQLFSLVSIKENLEFFFKILDKIEPFEGKIIYFMEEENPNYLKFYQKQLQPHLQHLDQFVSKELLLLKYYPKMMECFCGNKNIVIRPENLKEADEGTKIRFQNWGLRELDYFPISAEDRPAIGILIIVQKEVNLKQESIEQVRQLIQFFFPHLKNSLEVSKILANQKAIDSIKIKYKKLNHLARQINALLEPQKLYEIMIQELLQIYDFQLGFVEFENEGRLVLEYGLGLTPEAQELYAKLKNYFGNIQNAYKIAPPMNEEGGASCLVFVNRTPMFFYEIENLSKMPMTRKDKIALEIAGEALKSLVHIPIFNQEKTFGILQMWSLNSNRILTEGDLDMLTNICSFIPSILKNVELYALSESQKQEVEQKNRLIQLQNKEILEEIRLAQKIQQNIIPKNLPVLNGVRFSVLYKPMEQIGGDFYDFVSFSDPAQLGIFVSDVTGKGVPAALITTMLKSILESAVLQKDSPPALLEYINENICGQTNNNSLMAFYGIIDNESREFKYAAGTGADHYPVLIRQGKIQELKAKGKKLGITPNLFFEEKSLYLKKGDKVLIFTEGLTKTLDGEKKDFKEKLNFIINAMLDKPIHEMVDTIYIELIKHCEKYHFDDDICLVGLEIEA